ncbi:glycosyltransferase family 4 protein [Caldibacillus thermoamylovorans]
MKIAIIHDWLVNYAGAEKVLEEIIRIYPEADLFSVINFLPEDKKFFIQDKTVHTTLIQKLPCAKQKYRTYLPFMPFAIEQLDLSGYDLIISSSHAVAKGVITGPDQLHISYIHSPIRYAWDLQHQYLKESGLEYGLKGWIAKIMLKKIRDWDYRTANGVDYFLSNSDFIGRRIWKVYRRKSKTIYPPVDVSSFGFFDKKEDFYLTASRMVPYKKIDLIVEAFSHMPDKKLIVIGDGPDYKKVKSKASKNVILMGYQPYESLLYYMQRARAFVFAAEEDFGITPVEAQACGTPVIAYGKGGALETIIGEEAENQTGLFFKEQTVESLVDAVNKFEKIKTNIRYENCRENALRFSPERFREEFEMFVLEKLKEKFF